MSGAALTLFEFESDGRIADNIVYFARALRKAGMRLGPGSVAEAIQAVLVAGIGSREDFYWTLHAVLVKRHEDHPVFDEAFRLFWKSRELLEEMVASFSPIARGMRERQKPRTAQSRVADALFEGHQRNQPPREIPQIEIEARLTVSGYEILRAKDFAQMTSSELFEARRAIQDLRMPFDRVRTRRYRPDLRGNRIDPRATMRSAVSVGGELILPKFRQVTSVEPPIVALADISGSMSQYTRIFLHFLHALSENRRRVHTFVFGTRLTNLTRQMRNKDPDAALADCTAAVSDWSGGTRIGDTLKSFNRLWSRRVLGQGATVLLITDGLERDDAELLGIEMERLHKSCRKLIWLNPLLRFDGFEAKARGVRAMMPHVDEFRAVHNLDALSGLCAALNGNAGKGNDPHRWLQAIRI